MTEERIEFILGRLKSLTGDFGFMLLTDKMNEHEIDYRQGWNDATAKCIYRIDNLITQCLGEWNETLKCHDCNGAGFLTYAEHLKKYAI